MTEEFEDICRQLVRLLRFIELNAEVEWRETQGKRMHRSNFGLFISALPRQHTLLPTCQCVRKILKKHDRVILADDVMTGSYLTTRCVLGSSPPRMRSGGKHEED